MFLGTIFKRYEWDFKSSKRDLFLMLLFKKSWFPIEYISKNIKIYQSKHFCTFQFIEALFTINKIWNQKAYSSKEEKKWRKCSIIYHTIEYYSSWNQRNLTFCNNMDGCRGHYISWNKSATEKHITCSQLNVDSTKEHLKAQSRIESNGLRKLEI